MADLQNPRLIYLKGLLFLMCGTLSVGLLLVQSPSLTVAVLLALAIWCFARFYYFAFYVIEHYVDRDFRFAGLSAFVAYAIRQRLGWRQPPDEGQPT